MENRNIQKAYKCFERATTGNFDKERTTDLLLQYFEFIKKAAYSGDSEGQFLLGTLYQDEQFMFRISKCFNVVMNQKRAFYWFEKACNKNHPYACHNLGGFYGEAKVLPKDTEKEISLYLKAFYLGLSEAGYAIAIMKKQQSRYKDTFFWLNRVLELSPDDGEAIFELAKLYYEGRGVKKSLKSAFDLFLKSISTGYITEYTKEEVIFYVGQMYFYGYYVKKSKGKAKYLFEKANMDNDHEKIQAFLEQHRNELKKTRKIKVDFDDSPLGA